MSQQITVKVTSTSKNGQTYWQGTATVPGLRPAKLSRADGTINFNTASAVRAAAQRLGDRLNALVTFNGQTQLKQAAKKSANTGS